MKTTLTSSVVRALFGVRGGAYSDVNEPFLGAEALFEVVANDSEAVLGVGVRF